MCNSLGFGLALDLKKRRFFLKDDDTKDFDFLMFGSFDGLKIRKAEKLSGFIPTFDDDCGAAGINNDNSYKDYKFENEDYISTFILKLLNSGNINLDIWCGDEEQEIYPFFSMVMLNVSEAAAREYAKKGSKELLGDIRKYIDKEVLEDFDGYYDIFDSFGYYDYVILVKSNTLKKIKDFSDRLCNIKAENTNMLATVYTIFGIKNYENYDKANDVIVNGCKDITSIIIDLHLNGNSIINVNGEKKSFIDYLVDSIKGMDESIEVAAFSSEGESDVSIKICGERKGIIFKEYFDCGMLNPGNDYYNENVLSMRTRFFFDSILPNNKKNIENIEYRLSENCIKNYLGYVKLVNDEKRIQRRTTSLRQLVQRYYNIARYDHSFEIRTLVKPVFESLFLNIEKANLYLQNEIDSINIEKDNVAPDNIYERENNKIIFWSDYDEAVDCFREEVGSFISDISLSDRYFIENSQLKHPSIGSATKLIFFYNSLVNRIVREFQDKKDGASYSFLLKCGGRDEVKVKNIFDFLPHYDLSDKTKHQENCLLIVEIPERLLYNVPVTLCAVLHEIFHIIGDRNRKLRLKQILNGISTYIAWNFTEHLKKAYYDTKNDGDDLFECCRNEIKEGVYNNLLCKLLLNYLNLENHDKADMLRAQIKENCSKTEEFRIYLEEIYDEINELHMYSREFKDVYSVVSEFLEFEPVLNGKSELYKLVLDNCEKIRCTMYKNMMKSEKEKWLEDIDRFVVGYLGEYCNNNQIYKAGLTDAFISIYKDMMENIYDDIGIFIDAFLENYPEFMAISILDIDLEDYLIYLCFLKESSEEELIVLNENSILRYGSIIDFCYNNSIDIKECEHIFKLSDETKYKFKQKIAKFRTEKIFSEDIDENILLVRIDVLLNKYYEIYSKKGYYGKGLDISIKEYINEIKQKCNFEIDIVKDIRNLYRKFNLEILGIQSGKVLHNEESNSTFSKDLIEIIMDNWLKLAESN